MGKKITYFDIVLNSVKKLKKEQIWEACDILEHSNFVDLLDYGVENGCFSESESCTLYEGIETWNEIGDECSYEDPERLTLLCERMGITKECLENYSNGTLKPPVQQNIPAEPDEIYLNVKGGRFVMRKDAELDYDCLRIFFESENGEIKDVVAAVLDVDNDQQTIFYCYKNPYNKNYDRFTISHDEMITALNKRKNN